MRFRTSSWIEGGLYRQANLERVTNGDVAAGVVPRFGGGFGRFVRACPGYCRVGFGGWGCGEFAAEGTAVRFGLGTVRQSLSRLSPSGFLGLGGGGAGSLRRRGQPCGLGWGRFVCACPGYPRVVLGVGEEGVAGSLRRRGQPCGLGWGRFVRACPGYPRVVFGVGEVEGCGEFAAEGTAVRFGLGMVCPCLPRLSPSGFWGWGGGGCGEIAAEGTAVLAPAIPEWFLGLGRLA